MTTVIVVNSRFNPHYPVDIPKNTVNAEAVLIRLDSEWDNLTVRIHWLNVESGVEKVVLLERDQPNTIPWEVLDDLSELRMGLDGMDGGTIVKPTVWLTYGYVVDGVDPESGSDPQPPTPSWEQQMVEQATQASQAAQEAQKAAEDAAESAASAGPYAEQAKKSAEAAKVSQDAAATSAQQANEAAQTAQNAAGSIGDAVKRAEDAAAAAGTAQRAAETAQGAADQSAGAAQTAAGTAAEAAGAALGAAKEAGGYLDSVKADAQEAKDSAAAAGKSQEAAQSAAQEAANARDQANTAATNAQGYATAAGMAKTAAERAATTAGNAQAGAAQSAQEAAESASDAQEAKEAAEAAAATLPTPTKEAAGKAVVVNPDGTGYIFGESGGGKIDDTTLGRDTTWSSRMIVDSLAPAFEVSGPSITCTPVENYPLNVVSQIDSVQDGDGDPSVDNVRLINGWDGATLTHNNTPITLDFGQTVYGGQLDWTTGGLTVDWVKYVADGTEKPSLGQENTKVKRWYFSPTNPTLGNSGARSILCNILKTVTSASADETGCICSGANLISILLPKDSVQDADAVKGWLQANKPEFVYKTSKVETIQLSPTEVLALSGVNTLYTNTGDITVSGRADPNSVIKGLEDKIAEMQGDPLQAQSMLFSRSFAATYTLLPDSIALSIPDILPTWSELLERGEKVLGGVCLMHSGQCYRVVQEVKPIESQPPGADGMLAVYRPIDKEHDGTLIDPIPWVNGMDCFKDKYYSNEGKVYLCKQDMTPCVWAPGTAGVWQWEVVS